MLFAAVIDASPTTVGRRLGRVAPPAGRVRGPESGAPGPDWLVRDYGIPCLVLVPSDSDDITNKNCPRLILHAMNVKAFISRKFSKD